MDLHVHKIQTKNNDGKIFEISIDSTFELIISGKKYSFHELDLVDTNNFIILRECLKLENISLYSNQKRTSYISKNAAKILFSCLERIEARKKIFM